MAFRLREHPSEMDHGNVGAGPNTLALFESAFNYGQGAFINPTMPFAVKQQARTGSSVDLPLSRPIGQSAWPSHLCRKMSRDQNRPARAIAPYFIKEFGELGLRGEVTQHILFVCQPGR